MSILHVYEGNVFRAKWDLSDLRNLRLPEDENELTWVWRNVFILHMTVN